MSISNQLSSRLQQGQWYKNLETWTWRIKQPKKYVYLFPGRDISSTLSLPSIKGSNAYWWQDWKQQNIIMRSSVHSQMNQTIKTYNFRKDKEHNKWINKLNRRKGKIKMVKRKEIIWKKNQFIMEKMKRKRTMELRE